MEKFVYFNRLKFTRDDSTGYYLNSTIRKRLHRYVWEFYNGEIPKGYHIHHKDHDKSNNDISNLEMLSQAEHESLHGNELDKEWLRNNLATNARPKAVEWHKSEQGREFHKWLGKKSWENKEPITYKCTFCDAEFSTMNRYSPKSNHFCSNVCKAKFRRQSGVDNVERECIDCGEKFITNKYSHAKYCKHCRGKKH